METKVSVAMATYNGARFLDAQLRSLAEQTQKPAELIICDDGSSDETLQIAAAFAATAPFPVHIHRNEQRLGFRANFMRAASLCQSELIAFSDQDDIWEPRKIEVCACRFQDPEVLLAFHDALVIDSNGSEIGVFSRAAPRATNPPLSLDPWLFGLGFTTVLRKDLLVLNELWRNSIDHFFLEEPMSHDQWFFFLASVLGRIAYIGENLARYRQHDANLYGFKPWVSVPLLSRLIRLVPVRSRIKRLIDVSNIKTAASFAAGARKRAEILDAAQTMVPSHWAELALIARDKYLHIARRYDARRRLYTSPKVRQRFRALRELAASSAYAGDLWSCGATTGLKDLCVGVSFGHLLARRAGL